MPPRDSRQVTSIQSVSLLSYLPQIKLIFKKFYKANERQSNGDRWISFS